jgi:hypothetical protein
MVRKQICLDAELGQLLEDYATQAHVSQSETVRRALVDFLGGAQEQQRLASGREFLRLAAELASQMPVEHRRLTREELHDRALLRRLERPHLPE